MIWVETMWHGLRADYSRKWFTVLKGGLVANKKTMKVVDSLKG
jgi:hypothetical protein